MDPTRRRSGGALLGDRIRMNSLAADNIFMRSLATRRAHLATAAVLKDVIELYQAARLRPGHRRDRGHRPVGHRDRRPGGPVAVRHDQRVRRRQPAREDRHARLRRLHRAQQEREARRRRTVCATCASSGGAIIPSARSCPMRELPVYPTIASRFNDPGRQSAVRRARAGARREGTSAAASWQVADAGPTELGGARAADSRARAPVIWPRSPRRGRAHARAHRGAGRGGAARLRPLRVAEGAARRTAARAARALRAGALCRELGADATRRELRAAYNRALDEIGRGGASAELKAWPARVRAATDATYSYKVRERLVTGENYTESLSRSPIPKLAVPRLQGLGRAAALHPHREPARRLSLHRRRLSLPPRGGGSDAHVRRRGRDRSAPTAASTTSRDGHGAARCRPRSTRPRSTARIRTRARTSTGAPATPACRSRRSMT